MAVKYSFVVPIYNDAYLAEAFCNEYEQVFKKYLTTDNISNDTELIFVNDGSKDDSLQFLKAISNKYSFVKVIDLSRNFGQHIALSCGYKHAKGDYIGMLNVDMEDPPNQIPCLLDQFKNKDIDIVTGTYKHRNTTVFNKLTSFLFNYMLNNLTGYKVPLNVSTLRVMNRKFVNAYNTLSEKTRYLPGLEKWLGFNHEYIEIDHQKRKQGPSSYNFKKRLFMALDTVISFSDLPLKICVLTGSLIVFAGFLLTIILIIQKLLFINYQPGYTTTISLMVFFGGLQLLFIGLASLYIGRILKEVQNRPLYIIRDTYNL